MTSQHDPEREDDLRALFQETRDDADRMQLVKLRARAADVPARARHGRRWFGLAPILALAVAAAAVLFVTRVTHPTAQPPVATLAEGSAPAVPTATPSTSPAPEAEAVAKDDELPPALDSDDPEAAGDLGDLADPSADDPLAALDEPAADDVDAWLSATSSFLEGG